MSARRLGANRHDPPQAGDGHFVTDDGRRPLWCGEPAQG